MGKKKIITICSSASFFKDVIKIADRLRERGFEVKLPDTALRMKKSGDFDVIKHKVWLKDEGKFGKKRKLMDAHFKKVIESDTILVINKRKNGLKGYVGGNTLMEMTVAYLHKKPIFILQKPDKKLFCCEEIMGLQPIFLNRDLTKITL
jgi:hypothetical protein